MARLMLEGVRIVDVATGRVTEASDLELVGDRIAGIVPSARAADPPRWVVPGLIDVHVHIGAPGGIYADVKDLAAEHVSERALAQYLYCGVTTVKSACGARMPV